MADSKDISLPKPEESPAPQGGGSSGFPASPFPPVQAGMSGKEILLGSGIVLVAALMFFFLSRWFTDYLVKKRKSHTVSSRAGWSLFFFLTFTVCLLVFGALGHLWTTWLYIGTMSVLVLISLIMFLMSAFSSK